MNRFLILLLLTSALALTACGNGGNSADPMDTESQDSLSDEGTEVDLAEDIDVPEGLTYHKDVRGIIEYNCAGCHVDGGIAPDAFSFTEPEEFAALAEVAYSSMNGGRMPPWNINPECGEFHGDLSMSEEDLATVGAWIEQGKVMGDEADYEPVEPREVDFGTARLADHDAVELIPDEAYTPSTDEPDDFRCYVIDPGLDSQRFMTGYEAIVDNQSILHHMVMFKVGADERDALTTLENEDEAPGYECFGDARVSNQTVVAAWAPGGGAVGFPERTGIAYEPGDMVVLQMHYNQAEGGWGTDNSGARFWFAPKGQNPPLQAQMLFVGNMPFQIPAGVDGRQTSDCDTVYSRAGDGIPEPPEGSTPGEVIADPSLVGSTGCVQQDFYYQVPIPVKLWASFPHMHLVGTDIKVEVMETDMTNGGPAEGTDQCLIETHAWDFEWQRAYWYTEPITLPTDGMIRLTCRYNNALGDSPVSLGDGSGDEMCLALLYLTF